MATITYLHQKKSEQAKIYCRLSVSRNQVYKRKVNLTCSPKELEAIIDLTMDRLVDDVAEMIQINPINFDLNSSQVRPDAAIELEKIISILNEYPEMIVELGSHTDCRGSAPYNQALSQRRAISSLEYIQKRITTPERVSGKGFGESMLKNNCSCEGDTKSECSDSEHAENRRTEFILVQDKLYPLISHTFVISKT